MDNQLNLSTNGVCVKLIHSTCAQYKVGVLCVVHLQIFEMNSWIVLATTLLTRAVTHA